MSTIRPSGPPAEAPACRPMSLDATSCSKAPQVPVEKRDSAISQVAHEPCLLQQDDLSDTGGECRAAKPDDKQNDKPTGHDVDLRRVVKAWPDLPEAVRVGILAMVKSCEHSGPCTTPGPVSEDGTE